MIMSWDAACRLKFKDVPKELRRHFNNNIFYSTQEVSTRVFVEEYSKITALWQKGGEETEQLTYLE